MSYSAAQYDYTYDDLVYAPAAPVIVDVKPVLMPIVLLVPLFASLASWMAGGMQFLTDFSWIVLTAACTITVARELVFFPQRLRLGAIVLYGGTMVWYCHDYFSHWFNLDMTAVIVSYPPTVIAKGTFFTCLFVLGGALGLLLPTGQWLNKLMARVPEPGGNTVYLWLIAVTFLVGFSPYLFFTADPVYISVWKSITAMRSGDGTGWTVGRTGNLNYSWGGYLAQILQVGDVGGILAAFFAILVPCSWFARIICLAIWLLWTAIEWGSGSRGQFLFMILPVVGLVYIKYCGFAIAQLQTYSRRALLYTGTVMAIMLFFVQVQGTFRSVGLKAAELSSVELFKNQGNGMFTESLVGYDRFGDERAHPKNTVPGEGAVRVLPEVALRFAIGWIPRALWHDKPGISETSAEINKAMTGNDAINGKGGTITTSIAGTAYIYYGAAGVIEMGLLFGWICHCLDGALRTSFGRAFALLMTLGLATYMFRSFRDLTPHNLYPLLIGAVAMIMLHKFMPKSQPAAY